MAVFMGNYSYSAGGGSPLDFLPLPVFWSINALGRRQEAEGFATPTPPIYNGLSIESTLPALTSVKSPTFGPFLTSSFTSHAQVLSEPCNKVTHNTALPLDGSPIYSIT
jgi:hypothetical protein